MPEVAVTVTVEAVDCGLDGGAAPNVVAPPQPEKNDAPRTQSVSIESSARRFFPPKNQIAAARAAPGNHNAGVPRRLADDFAVWIVSIETILPPVTTVVGAKVQVAPLGRPEQAKSICELERKPFSGVTIIVSVLLWPAVTVNEGAEAASVKSAGDVVPAVTASENVAECCKVPEIAVTVTVDVEA